MKKSKTGKREVVQLLEVYIKIKTQDARRKQHTSHTLGSKNGAVHTEAYSMHTHLVSIG